jgi:hypothetical protein
MTVGFDGYSWHAKNVRENKTTTPTKLPISTKNSAKRCDNRNCAEIWSKIRLQISK